MNATEEEQLAIEVARLAALLKISVEDAIRMLLAVRLMVWHR